MDANSEFLQERLAAAAAIPPERRSADVSAFLESCQLQQEVLEALQASGGSQFRYIKALKLDRARYVSLGIVSFTPVLIHFFAWPPTWSPERGGRRSAAGPRPAERRPAANHLCQSHCITLILHSPSLNRSDSFQ